MKLRLPIVLFSLFVLQACATQSIVKEGSSSDLNQFIESNNPASFQIVLENGETFKTYTLSLDSNDTLSWAEEKYNINQVNKVKAKRIKIATIGVLAAGFSTILFTSLPPPNCVSDSCTPEQLGNAYGNIMYKSLVGLATLGAVFWIESKNPQRVFVVNPKLKK